MVAFAGRKLERILSTSAAVVWCGRAAIHKGSKYLWAVFFVLYLFLVSEPVCDFAVAKRQSIPRHMLHTLALPSPLRPEMQLLVCEGL
jgi:hypothetical protein